MQVLQGLVEHFNDTYPEESVEQIVANWFSYNDNYLSLLKRVEDIDRTYRRL